MSQEDKKELVTSQEKYRFLLATAAIAIPTIIYNFAKSGKSAGDRIRHILTGSALGLGLGVLVVLLPRIIYGRKATTPLKDTKIVSKLKDQFSRRDRQSSMAETPAPESSVTSDDTEE